jgi:ferredoxin
MKTTIFYFTGTDNSLKVAKDIADGLGETELIPISKAIKSDIKLTADRIGLVFPVYMWGMPSLVVDFVNKLSASDKYFFAVATYGGSEGATSVQAQELLKKRGIELSLGFSVLMPGNYTPLYGAISIEKQLNMFDKSRGKIESIVESIKKGEKGIIEKGNILINIFLSGLMYKLSMPRIHKMDKKFFADESCTKCGICEKVCPVGNIILKDGIPSWNQKCEQCLACLQWCPVSAIQYGKATIGRRRYHHPEIKVTEFYQ